MNIINAIFKFFIIIAPIILTGLLVYITRKYWKESERSAKVQLFEAFNRILDSKYKELNKLNANFIKYTLEQDRSSVNSCYLSIMRIINQIKSLSTAYEKNVSEVDNLYAYKGSLVSALVFKDNNYNQLQHEVIKSTIESINANIKADCPMHPDFYNYCLDLIDKMLKAVK
jgi:hypothetical protein